MSKPQRFKKFLFSNCFFSPLISVGNVQEKNGSYYLSTTTLLLLNICFHFLLVTSCHHVISSSKLLLLCRMTVCSPSVNIGHPLTIQYRTNTTLNELYWKLGFAWRKKETLYSISAHCIFQLCLSKRGPILASPFCTPQIVFMV